MTDGRIGRIGVLPVVLALLAAGLLTAIVFLGAPATSSAAQPTYSCTNGVRTFGSVNPKTRSGLEKSGFTCTKNS